MPIKEKSADSYRSDVRIVQGLFPELDFTALQLKIALEGKYKNKKTAKNRFDSLKTILNFSKSEGLITYNPFDEKVKPIRINYESNSNFPFNDYERSIIEPELKKIPKLWLYTRFIYYTFSRPNEIINLRVQDINLRTRTIRIQPEFSKPGRTLVKPILKPLLDLILEFRILENPNSFYVFGDHLECSSFPCYKNHAANLHRKVLEKLNMYRPRETVPYAWKPTGNINAYMAGMDLKLIQQINGHKSIQTTEIYLRKLGLWLEKQAHDIVF